MYALSLQLLPSCPCHNGQRLTHSQLLAHSQRDEESLQALKDERDAALEHASAARREADAALREKDAATSRVDRWVGVALALQSTAAGLAFIQECSPEMQEEVRNPTPGAQRYKTDFLSRPLRRVAGSQPTQSRRRTYYQGA